MTILRLCFVFLFGETFAGDDVKVLDDGDKGPVSYNDLLSDNEVIVGSATNLEAKYKQNKKQNSENSSNETL